MKIIIDSGHGWNTPGKRSEGFYTQKGLVRLKENSFNEAICNKLSILFKLNKVNFRFISNQWYDITLADRVKLEHAYYSQNESFFISIHADAFHTPNATGATFFYYSEKTKEVAEKFTQYLIDNDYPLKVRSPKQANFYVLRNTKSPALLFEAGFMTTEKDLSTLLNEDSRNYISILLFNAIFEIIVKGKSYYD